MTHLDVAAIRELVDWYRKCAAKDVGDHHRWARAADVLSGMESGGPCLNTAEWYAENGSAFEAIEELEEADDLRRKARVT